MELALSEIKEIKDFAGSDWREIVEGMADEDDDFEVGNYRFIHENVIDEIMTDELESDEYILGCFNASVIAEATGWPQALIEAAQKGEAYEEIGKAMEREHIEELQRLYVEADGYGHHFARYDGNEYQFGEYYAFRI